MTCCRNLAVGVAPLSALTVSHLSSFLVSLFAPKWALGHGMSFVASLVQRLFWATSCLITR